MGRWPGGGRRPFRRLELLYLPLQTGGRVVGVLGMKLKNPDESLSPESRRLLEAFASQAALAIERAHLAQKARTGTASASDRKTGKVSAQLDLP